MMIAEGIVLGILIGLILGTTGAGGAILAVPGLIAIMGLSTVAATTSSLVIVAAAAVAGFIPRLKIKAVDVRLGLTFSALGIFGTYLGTQLVDVIPETFQVLLFATLMLTSAIALWRGPASGAVERTKTSWPLVIALATGIGTLTGLLGVGGGALVVPALVLVLKVPIKTAAGTSLVVISSNATIAFFMRYQYWNEVPVTPIIAFTVTAVVASFLAAPLAGKISARTLQRSFAGFMAMFAIIIILSRVL